MTVTSIALSGLNAAERRISTSANNVANVNTTTTRQPDGTVVNEAFEAQRVVQTPLQGGGVQARTVTADTPTLRIFDPENPIAAEDGTVEIPNVSLDEEVVQQNIATYDFKANVRVLKTQQELDKSLLDITA